MNKQYPEYISEKRIPVESPKDLVDENGNAIFGTFKDPIEQINLLKTKKPCGKMPDSMKKNRLTRWEAFEISMDEGALVSAVYDMGIIGFSICAWYSKEEKKVYKWVDLGSPKKMTVADTLYSSITEHKKKEMYYVIENDFGNGKVHGKAKKSGKCGDFEFDMSGVRICPPSIVNIPLGPNRPLYTEKDIFQATGYVLINGKRYETNSNSYIIIDDHKGYYPFKAHYDWLTGMEQIEIDGEKKCFSFNLTWNQSIDRDAYNENYIWVDNSMTPLPPVKFEHPKKNVWTIKDEYGHVDLSYTIDDVLPIVLHLGIIDLAYYLTFGIIKGTLKDLNGKVYTLDGMLGIGEDKTTRI